MVKDVLGSLLLLGGALWLWLGLVQAQRRQLRLLITSILRRKKAILILDRIAFFYDGGRRRMQSMHPFPQQNIFRCGTRNRCLKT